jgi:hypothetical protein
MNQISSTENKNQAEGKPLHRDLGAALRSSTISAENNRPTPKQDAKEMFSLKSKQVSYNYGGHRHPSLI